MANDSFGIRKLFRTKTGGQTINILQTDRVRSDHSGGNRDQWTKDCNFLPMEATLYLKSGSTPSDDESGLKIWGGEHNSTYPRRGRCYDLGVENNGTPHIAKEYPEHPDGEYGLGATKAQYQSSLRTLPVNPRGNWIGIKLVAYIQAGVPTFLFFVDTSGLDANGNPKNNWQYWYKAEDKGDWIGEPYLTQQGVANGGVGKFYLRIDNVSAISEVKGFTVRELDINPIFDGTYTSIQNFLSDTGTPQTGLATPTLTLSELSKGSVKLDWNLITGATKYEVWATAPNTSLFQQVSTVLTNTFSIANIPLGITKFKVFAANDTQRSVGSNETEYNHTSVGSTPLTPVLTLGTFTEPNRIRLTWTNPLTTNIIEKKNSAGSWSQIALTGNTTFETTLSSTPPLNEFRVKTRNTSNIDSSYSNVVSKLYTSSETKSLVLIQTITGHIYVMNLSNSEIAEFESSGGSVFSVTRVRLNLIFADGSNQLTEWLTLADIQRDLFVYNNLVSFGGIIEIVQTDDGDTPTELTAPLITLTELSKGSIRLNWNAITGATKYEVWATPVNTSLFQQISTVTTNTFSTQNIPVGITKFKVFAANDTQRSAGSNEASYDHTSGGTTTLTAPVLLSAADPLVKNKHLLTWNIVTGATSYQLETRNAIDNIWILHFDQNTNMLETTISQSIPKVEYRVRAKNSTQTSNYSNIVTLEFVPEGTPILTTPVLSITKDPLDQNKIKLSWNAITGATAYRVESKKNTDTLWGGSAHTSNLFYDFILQEQNGTQQFRVRAQNVSNVSLYSNVVEASYIPPNNQILDITMVSVTTNGNQNVIRGFLNDTNLNNWVTANNTSKLCELAIFTGYDVPCSLSYDIFPTKFSSTIHPDNYGDFLLNIRSRFNQTGGDDGSGLGKKKDIISMVTKAFVMVTGISMLGVGNK